MEQHKKFMKKTLALARQAARKGEVPIAALLIKNGKVLAAAHNLTKTDRDPTAHAEMIVLRKAAKLLKNERLLDTQLYVTLEPCAMCAGAIVQARIPEVIFGAWDARAGACGSVLEVLPNENLNHRPVVISEILAEDSARLLKSFFRRRR